MATTLTGSGDELLACFIARSPIAVGRLFVILVKMTFSVRLTAFTQYQLYPNGPIFSRYLPNGEADGVCLTPDGDPHEIQVWFTRRTKKVSGGMLAWDLTGTEFDPETMRRQAKLDGGWLFGKMNMPVSQAELAALRQDPKATPQEFGDFREDSDYVALAKRLIKTLQPRLAAFVSTLRSQYGQYWLEVPRPWDSRSGETLGTHCTGKLMLKWWHEEKQGWFWVLPTRCGINITVQTPPDNYFNQYLTEADWRRLQAGRCLVDVSTELQLLANAGKSLDSGDYRQSFVEVLSALELTISRRLASQNEKIKAATDSFLDGETRSAHIAVVMLMIGAPEQDIETALKAVNIRNRVVHEGYQPTESDGRILREVMQAIRKIGKLDELKSPSLDFGYNTLFSADSQS